LLPPVWYHGVEPSFLGYPREVSPCVSEQFSLVLLSTLQLADFLNGQKAEQVPHPLMGWLPILTAYVLHQMLSHLQHGVGSTEVGDRASHVILPEHTAKRDTSSSLSRASHGCAVEQILLPVPQTGGACRASHTYSSGSIRVCGLHYWLIEIGHCAGTLAVL